MAFLTAANSRLSLSIKVSNTTVDSGLEIEVVSSLLWVSLVFILLRQDELIDDAVVSHIEPDDEFVDGI